MRKIIAYIMMIFMGIQIVLGSLFFMTNLSAVQEFRENIHLPLPAGVIYLVQMALSATAVWYFLGKIGLAEKKFVRGFITVYLLTVPYLLQMHMAKLTCSVTLSVLIWMLGLVIETGESGITRKRGILLGTAYFLYGLLCPDGIWLGGIVLLAAWVIYRKKKVYYLMAIFAIGILIFIVNLGLNNLFPEERNEYRYNTISYTMTARFVWPNFATSYYFWGEEVKAVMSEEDAVDVHQRIERIQEYFLPALEQKYGKKRADWLCSQMAEDCLIFRTRETLTEIAVDFKDYLLVPFTIEKNLRGEGTSLTGWNYGRMYAHTPWLVKYYFRYGYFELPVLLLGSILLWLGRKNDQNSQQNKSGKLLLFTALMYVVWYTMRSNLPIDYKQVLPVLFVWYLAAVFGIKWVSFEQLFLWKKTKNDSFSDRK